MRIFIDADGCPVKEETYKVAIRYQIPVIVVANKRLQTPFHPLITIAPNTTRPLASIEMVDSLGPVFIADTQKSYLQGVSLESMELTFPPDLKQNATLSILYNRLSNNRAEATSTVRKTIKIALQRSAPDKLASCTSITEVGLAGDAGNEDVDKELCESFALMKWNADLRICELKENLCPPATIFEGIDASGNKKCGKLADYAQYLINPSFTQSCPDDFDQVKLNRSLISPWQVSIECNKKGESCPSTHNTSWYGKPTECKGYLPRKRDGETYLATDDLPPSTGSALYECDKGKWKIAPGTNNCIAPCYAGTRAWQTGVNKCDGPSMTIQDGESINVEDTLNPTLGSSTWKCVTGSWSLQGGHSCKSPCLPGTKSWTVNGATCTATFPLVNDTQLITLNDTTAPSLGTANLKCENGSLNVKSSTCVVPPEPGICKWKLEITWQNPDCTGFQVNQLETSTGQMKVNSKNECTSFCSACQNGKTYDGCTYTAD
jgi:hypothetical protein